MRLHEDRATGGFIDAARLHADKPVLDEIHPADAVLAAEFVERLQHAARGEFFAVHRDAVAFHEIEFHVFRFVRRVFRRDGEFEHRLVLRRGRIEPRIFQNAGLVGNMEEIAIHRIRLLEGSFDRDLMLRAVSDHFGPAREEGAVRLHLPRRDDLELRGERHVGELKTALIVAFAGGAVRDRVGLFFLGDVHLGFGDQRPGDRGAQIVLPLVNRVGADHRVDEVARKLLDEIERVVLRSAGLERLFVEPLELLLLADIGRERDDLSVVSFFEPLDDDGRVESARVCEDDFHDESALVWMKSYLRADCARTAMIAFCVCRRFSAWSKMIERGLSNTACSTSSPAWAGRQCMNSASGLAAANNFAVTA